MGVFCNTHFIFRVIIMSISAENRLNDNLTLFNLLTLIIIKLLCGFQEMVNMIQMRYLLRPCKSALMVSLDDFKSATVSG